ncbi:hypothetical protein [Nocardia xishanensis]|uniref:hypothetical protein n=1 Tax=Nocardia xishanensis TaxID=238964 RepID=UPI000A9B836A|nr:hypothetical protein [Nocardia xishanensis]
MPATPRRHFSDLRRTYTGEDAPSAKAGVGRKTVGLVDFTDQQRRFRALLALSLFNFDSAGRQHPIVSVYNASTFLSYTMTVSPRFDLLVFVVPGAPENAVGRLLGSPTYPDTGVPGLRLFAAGKAAGRALGECFHLLHLPTGARAVVTASSTFETAHNADGPIDDRYPGPDMPLTDVERAAVDGVPPMTVEIETILAALVSYLNVRDPDRRWATGTWWWDPFHRPPRPGLARPFERFSQLWGTDKTWELSWNGYPYPEDLAACFTAPMIGLPQASFVQERGRAHIRLGSSSLTLVYGGTCPAAAQRHTQLMPARRNSRSNSK